jgi:hypothetical protein
MDGDVTHVISVIEQSNYMAIISNVGGGGRATLGSVSRSQVRLLSAKSGCALLPNQHSSRG